jgi:SAM-dependent methyltransferase
VYRRDPESVAAGLPVSEDHALVDRDDLVRDTLPVNQPYNGPVAEAYDVWLPPDGNYADRDVYRELIRDGDGPALELGCGNGRLLVGYRVDDGLDVEGVDSSADMLAICRGHCAARGVDVVLHHADWVTLALEREFATLYNPSSSFSLLHQEADARRALSAWRSHLGPGGKLAISMSVPGDEQPRRWQWFLRRSATRETDGTTFMVHQAVRTHRRAQFHDTIDRHEVWAADGTLRTTYQRRHRLRWWTPDQLADLLRGCGYSDPEPVGVEPDFVVVARR